MIGRFVVLLIGLGLATDVLAGGTCSGVKGGCGRSRSRSSSSSSGGTVHVNGYTRKDGTYVRPHTRRAPGTASYDYEPDPAPAPQPIISYRTTARTSARTHAWNGNVTDRDETEEADASIPAGPARDLRTWFSADGKFSIEAEFVSYANGTLTLRKTDWTFISVELNKLCEADKAWVKARGSGAARRRPTP